MTRPFCGYLWAIPCSIWILIACISAVEFIAKDGMNWLSWIELPIAIGVHAYIIRLIWRP